LEKYGGIAVDPYNIPLKIVPDDMLSNKFLLSFLEENSYGTRLSYRIIASVPGGTEHGNIGNNMGRVYVGNNFFKGIQRQTQSQTQSQTQIQTQTQNSEDIISYPTIFNDLYNILKSNYDGDRIKILDDYLLSQIDVMVYPSYYFNPNLSSAPKKLLNSAIIINLWKSVAQKIRNKTVLRRKYIVTPTSIVSKLNENPKDRLKNTNKI
ncbi:MAG: hypothetical protein Satyrvirus48_1, partial [Satyrvirus sp.]